MRREESFSLKLKTVMALYHTKIIFKTQNKNMS